MIFFFFFPPTLYQHEVESTHYTVRKGCRNLNSFSAAWGLEEGNSAQAVNKAKAFREDLPRGGRLCLSPGGLGLFRHGVGVVSLCGEHVPAAVACYGPCLGGMHVVPEGRCRSLHTGMTFQAVLPGQPKSSPSRGERGGTNLGKPERRREMWQEGARAEAASCQAPGSVLRSRTQPSLFLLARMGYTMEQPPQLGGISLLIHHPMDTDPRFWGWAEVLLLTKLLLFSSAPISSFSPYSPAS